MQLCLRWAYALILPSRRGRLVVGGVTYLMWLAMATGWSVQGACCCARPPSATDMDVDVDESVSAGSTQAPTSELQTAATSAAARQEALKAIRFDRIASPMCDQVRQVATNPTLFRRLPTSVVDCYPQLFTCLAENPEVLVEIWRQLGVSNVDLERVGPSEFRLSDSAGTTGRLTLVDQKYDAAAQNRVTMFAEGRYEGKPFARPVTARCVLLLRSGSVVETNGRTFVAARLDTFIKFDRPGLELAAKVVHPWVGGTADRNFTDTLTFISNLSFTAEHRPETLERLARDLKNVDAERRRQFVATSYNCAAHGRKLRQDRESVLSGERQAAAETDSLR